MLLIASNTHMYKKDNDIILEAIYRKEDETIAVQNRIDAQWLNYLLATKEAWEVAERTLEKIIWKRE